MRAALNQYGLLTGRAGRMALQTRRALFARILSDADARAALRAQLRADPNRLAALPYRLGAALNAPGPAGRLHRGQEPAAARINAPHIAKGAKNWYNYTAIPRKEPPMPQTPAISIVTTVYDAKEYLPHTVQSILAQTFTDFELLLVEDGSPNGCGELCDELAKTDPRIRVFHKPNGGPASAANVGLDNARGGYIGFVDSDDLIEPDIYERLYNAIQATGARIAACVGDAIDEQDAPIAGRDVSLRAYGVRDAEDLLLETFQTGSFYGPLSWNKLFDIRTFRDKGVRYDETMFLATTRAFCTWCSRASAPRACRMCCIITAPAAAR